MTQEAAAPLERVQNPSQSATRPADQPIDPHSREQFQSLILDHSSNPLNFGKLVEPHSTGFGENRVCGDRCRIFLRVANNRIEAIRFVGTGCAISMASASMMTRIVDGLELPETEILIDRVRLLFTDRAVEADDTWGDLKSLVGVRDFPPRVKCASLPWHTLRAALRSATETVTTE